MTYRNAIIHDELQHMKVGPFAVKQPLPSSTLNGVSPFLLLHHAGPSHYAPGAIKARLSPHPHRGFEPVTFLFSGKLHHKDSTGSEGLLAAGDVQWMTAGRGIIHSEGPSALFADEGGEMELVQLWVNLPRDHKMTPPKYQNLQKERIPVVREDGFDWQVVAGSFRSVEGPASTFTPITAMTAHFAGGSATVVEVPREYNVLVYVLDGRLSSNGSKIDKQQMAVYDHGSEGVHLEAEESGKLLFLAGLPIHEPVASCGPFVMNYPGEIKQAILDYETGKMGVLEY